MSHNLCDIYGNLFKFNSHKINMIRYKNSWTGSQFAIAWKGLARQWIDSLQGDETIKIISIDSIYISICIYVYESKRPEELKID